MKHLNTLLLVAAFTLTSQPGYSKNIQAKRIDKVDTYHGIKVNDPYQWMEGPDQPDLATWLKSQEQNKKSFFQNIASKKYFKERLTKLWAYKRISTPYKVGKNYFMMINDVEKKRGILHVTDSLDKKPKVLVDPNTYFKKGTVAIGRYSVNDDGTLVAFSINHSGSDWEEWRMIEVSTGKVLKDLLKGIKWGNVRWAKDSSGLLYSGFPDRSNLETADAENEGIYYHKLGTAQNQDLLLYKPENPKWGTIINVVGDGKFLSIRTYTNSSGKGSLKLLALKNLATLNNKTAKNLKVTTLVEKHDKKYWNIGSTKNVAWYLSSHNANNLKIIEVDLHKPDISTAKTIVPESDAPIIWADYAGGKIFIRYLKDAQSKVSVYDINKKKAFNFSLPGIGTVYGLTGRNKTNEIFYTFENFYTPSSVYKYDIQKGESSLFFKPKVDIDLSPYTTKQVFYKSKDGTKVPMFITYKKGVKRNKKNKTILYAYGSYGNTTKPSYKTPVITWLEKGGIYAVANIRGGGEYGEKWHKAGSHLNHQNRFDDFIYAAKYLIKKRYTTASRIASHGISSGGLLVAGTAIQQPDVFGVVLCEVGSLDLLRFHKFTGGFLWQGEYGTVEDKEQFKNLYALSPLHNIKENTDYPAFFITTGTHDTRVLPVHSYKFAASLQHTYKGKNPVILRVQTNGGHYKSYLTREKLIELESDRLSFAYEMTK